MKRVVKILLIIGIILLLIGILLYIFGGIEVKLIGSDNITTTYKEEYKDEGFIITKYDEKVNSNKYSYNIDSNVDINNLGTYKYDYDIKYLFMNFKLSRTVQVVDDVAPSINTNVSEVKKDYCTKKILTDISYIALDNYDGDVTDKVIKDEQNEEIILKVSDSFGNENITKIPVVYSDKPSDIFTLNGNNTIYLALNSSYKEQGTTYKDGCGNKIDVNVITKGSVNSSKEGNYEITYTANGKTLTRKVIVYKPSVSTSQGVKEKIIYLTFDDGPGAYTEKVLNTLAKYNVKATFFVTHQFSKYVPLIKKEYESGHSVGVHSYTHNWNIYKSVDAYVNDFNKMNDDIIKYTGSKSFIFRFPGGSSNTVSRSYAKGVVKAIASKMTENGYAYFDWDVDSGDAANASRSKIYSNVTNGVNKCSKCIVLMHDIKPNTVNELDNILNNLTSRGFKFGTLSVNSPTVHHSIAN